MLHATEKQGDRETGDREKLVAHANQANNLCNTACIGRPQRSACNRDGKGVHTFVSVTGLVALVLNVFKGET